MMTRRGAWNGGTCAHMLLVAWPPGMPSNGRERMVVFGITCDLFDNAAL